MQISDENLHRVRMLMDEVFGPENFCRADRLQEDQRSGGSATCLDLCDYLLWYAKRPAQMQSIRQALSRAKSRSSEDDTTRRVESAPDEDSASTMVTSNRGATLVTATGCGMCFDPTR